MKKPPDKYKCIKLPLSHILKNQQHKAIINDAAFKIVIKAYQLIRLWLLTKFDNNETLPKVNRNTFSVAFRCLKLKSQGKKSDLFKEFESIHHFQKEDASQLTQILEQYSSIEMLTAFENNIKLHFFDYLRRYVNSYWKNQFKEQLENKSLTLTT